MTSNEVSSMEAEMYIEALGEAIGNLNDFPDVLRFATTDGRVIVYRADDNFEDEGVQW